MSIHRLFFLIIFSTVFLAASFAQTNSDGFIVGQITECSSGQPIAGAKISIENKAETTSDADGKYLVILIDKKQEFFS